ncbi:MAG TPA: Mut7-C RNAse domain-containing protein [Vicinamibacteria bacterium]|nr:Mut7-C RNAse domain-containing protein [Vicinamibacteria bacterium]
MGRIEDGFRRRFRELLARVRPRRLEFGVELLMGRARERARREGLDGVDAFTRMYEETRTKVERRLKVMAACAVVPRPEPRADVPRFLCDASLGGLGRWLRAAGYEAEVSGSAGDALVREAQGAGRVLVTTDARLWDRRLLREGVVEALWLPSGLDVVRQLGMVRRDLALELRPPRCMACGGELRAVEKAEVAARIPPRTARWKDDYFVCGRCGRLLWEGTHWDRIAARLASC